MDAAPSRSSLRRFPSRARLSRDQGRHRRRPISPGRSAVGSHAREGSQHEPHAGARKPHAAVAGALPRSRRRSRVLRRTRHRAVDSRDVRRAARARGRRGRMGGRARDRGGDCATQTSARRLPHAADDDRHDTRGAPAEYRDAEAANVRFHLAIASAARNMLAMELIDRCLAKVDRFMSLGVHFGPFQQGATEAHLAIVEAIERRDSAAARARMEEHLDCGSRLMKEVLLRGQLTHVGVL